MSNITKPVPTSKDPRVTPIDHGIGTPTLDAMVRHDLRRIDQYSDEYQAWLRARSDATVG